MKLAELYKSMAELEHKGVFVLAKRDVEKLFPEEQDKALEKSLQRMVAAQVLTRVYKGLYVNPAAAGRRPGRVIEEIAKALRPAALSYVSLESMLSEFGVISQIPMSRLTVMTTGASGLIKTPYGDVEFTHTKRTRADIMERTLAVPGRPLRIAKKLAAFKDLVRVGRNVDLVDREELAEEAVE
jgi:Family of unknown function (DUF6088)